MEIGLNEINRLGEKCKRETAPLFTLPQRRNPARAVAQGAAVAAPEALNILIAQRAVGQHHRRIAGRDHRRGVSGGKGGARAQQEGKQQR